MNPLTKTTYSFSYQFNNKLIKKKKRRRLKQQKPYKPKPRYSILSTKKQKDTVIRERRKPWIQNPKAEAMKGDEAEKGL